MELVWKVENVENEKRRRQKKWDGEHMVTISSRLTVREDAVVRLFCNTHGITRYSLVKSGIAQYMGVAL